jgi:hypothetical protein
MNERIFGKTTEYDCLIAVVKTIIIALHRAGADVHRKATYTMQDRGAPGILERSAHHRGRCGECEALS